MKYNREQIQRTFQFHFDINIWVEYVTDFFHAQEVYRIPQSLDIDASEGKGYEIGYLNTTDDYRIGFFYLKLNKSVARSRVGLRQMISRYLKIDSDAGIVVFDDGEHWRLSFITDLRGEKTSPKRYTFVFGEKKNQYRTAVDRFVELQKNGISFKTIKEAFSVEALTKQFYNDLFNWYTWAVKEETGVYFPNDPNIQNDDREQIDTKMIRLITRLMFVWFIKQKGLVPDALFDPDEVQHWLKDFDAQSMKSGNYYQAILQNLFFATLNRPIKTITYDKDGLEIVERRGFAHLQGKPDVKSLYRYQELFKISEDKILSIFEFVPFINGGLFECLDKNKTSDGVDSAYYHDGFSRNNTFVNGRWTRRAFIPNKLFFDPEDGILSIFNRYNFTVEENSPSEQQVALDPELLGKVFENLLGVYNPETQETARNQSGSFYTPREIVDYMVVKSLESYLGNTKEVRALFDDKFEYDESQKAFYQSVIEKLKQIKVLDPACGSGAFPMGMLNRIVQLMQTLHVEEPKYDLKLQIMENCIYGGDIQSIAAQITKLRFFISLVCDCQKTDNADDNYGIPNLPNLETHFVTCDSLVALMKPQGLSLFEQDVVALKEKLKEVRHEHFTSKTVYQKTKLRNRDKELRDELAKMLSDDNVIASEDAKQMAEWNPYDQNGQASFFDPEWMFGIKDGFDVVIGNPPYISTKGVTNANKKRYEAQFGFSDDTYNLFTLRAIGCTFRDRKNTYTVNGLVKQNGTLIYIIPKTFWTTQTKRFMRDVLLNKQINLIYDTANPFEAVMVDTCIIQVANTPYRKEHDIDFWDGSTSLSEPTHFSPIKQEVYRETQNAVIFKPTDLNLRIWNLYGQKVKALYDEWWEKIKTSRDIEKNKTKLEQYRASLKPGDIVLLGCLTEGGQGLATANNGKYVAIRKSSKWADNVYSSRPKKLAEAIQKYPKVSNYIGNVSPLTFLDNSSEQVIADTFDKIKEEFGRDVFGQGYIYKLIDDSEIADVDLLTEDEKQNGIDTAKPFYVPYDKGDKDGNRWYLETPFAIAWSKENVHFLKTDPKARYQGYTFFFKEGFCWSDINTTFLKCRIKQKSIHDVKSMSLFGMTDNIPEWYMICIINSLFMSRYVDDFVNNTQTFQINDARQLPIIIPSKDVLNNLSKIFISAQSIQKQVFAHAITSETAYRELEKQQNMLDSIVHSLYLV